MLHNKSRALKHPATLILSTLIAWLSVLAFVDRAEAIPVFARKYGTSCITCHAGFPKLNGEGEAFRRNGYQFPIDDDLQVKDEPIIMGDESYKEIWPNAIWPSDIPHLPPVAFRARMGVKQFLDTPTGSPGPDFQFPMDYSLLSAGTFGENISWYAGMVLAGRGGHGGGGAHGGGEAEGLEPELERLFVQFSNLFAWSKYDDDDGTRLGNRWISLPRHAMNLRVGQFEPQVIAPWSSIHRQLGAQGRLPNLATMGANSFMFEPALRGFELHGVLRQYNSYAIGLVNGNSTMTAWDNNTPKDFYFRVARKWWGYPLDGVIGEANIVDDGGPAYEDPSADELGPPGMDFWREIAFETGFFGYFGRNTVMAEEDENVIFHGEVHGTEEHMMMRFDDFYRLGYDTRFQFQDLDLFGACVWGWDSDPVSHDDPNAIQSETMFTWFVEADYVCKPWLTLFGRYEELEFSSADRQEENAIARGVTGAVFTVRTNMRVITEVVIDAQGNGTTDDALQVVLDFAY